MNKKKKPDFIIPNSKSIMRVPSRWRKPRGIDNKKRIRLAAHGKSPRIGYKNSSIVRFTHPCGNFEVIVHNPAQLEGLKDVVIRISGPVGNKKRIAIVKRAGELKLRVLNPKVKLRESKPKTGANEPKGGEIKPKPEANEPKGEKK
jgi:large subunit ribosomal protein L32e